MFIAAAPDDPVALIEAALLAVVAADAIEGRMRAAVKAGTLAGASPQERIANALAAGLISTGDVAALEHARELTDQVIHVDDFAPTSLPAENIVAPPSLARAA
jgi:acyl-CoA dehydrogenase